ncbi:rhomboid family intramembrane serine protease [Capnocytophaga sp. ARDL2]|uniref:rhomboid family intramembrane serine protease n=1 Tax=Capnocytophaga sp. ARDL2 TaxID=3238809 RepID=UPI003557EBBC
MNTNQIRIKKEQFTIPLLFIFILWSIYYINWRFSFEWENFGIHPRELFGLKGILFSPFLHGSIEHIANNSIAIIVLFPLVLYYYPKYWKVLFIGGIVLSGLGTWLIAESGVHIGASGLIYVFTAYLFFTGLRSKNFRLMAVSFFVVLFYGSSIWYMFPNVKEGISWQGHLAGFLTGLSFSYLLPIHSTEKTYAYDWQRPDFDPMKDDFMKHFDAKGNFKPKPECIIDKDGYVFLKYKKLPITKQRIQVKNFELSLSQIYVVKNK